MKRAVSSIRRRRRSEHAFVLDAHKRLRAMGIPSRREAPLLGRSIDLVYIHGGDLITVEFKLSDWRRALDQARDHQIGSDFSYICLAEASASPELEAEAKRVGVGLFYFVEDAAWPFFTAVNALRSAIASPFARDTLSSLVTTSQT